MTDYELFLSLGEPFGAGLFERDGEPIVRYANASKRYFELAKMPAYSGGALYPASKNIFNYDETVTIRPHYSNTFEVCFEGIKAKSERAYEIISEEYLRVSNFKDSPHIVGGHGWTHAFPNYERVLKEGLLGYEKRVNALPNGDFKQGLTILLEGIRIYHERCLSLLKEQNASERLILALEKVPYHPASNIYEAIVSINFIFYLDGCDNIGALDKILLPYYHGEDIVPLLREFFANVDDNDGWSGTLGPDYNEITRACLRAISNGRRPNLQLLVNPDMPDWVWEECVASLSTSCGQPALYNHGLYLKSIKERMPFVSEKDRERLVFGGCTETMFDGVSAVGSDDAGINLALIFSNYMRENLCRANTYNEFYLGLISATKTTVYEVLDKLNEHRRTRALYRPAVMRTLFVDDCIDAQVEFNAGGARYCYSVINMAGLINVIDSLCVIKKLVYEQKEYSPSEFIAKLDERDSELLRKAKSCASYGNDNDEADGVGKTLVQDITSLLLGKKCYPRGEFYFVANQFTTYAEAGKDIPATPDGRGDGAPLCDSLGAIHGNDFLGATALLNSVSKLGLERIIGTPTTNIRISKQQLALTLKPLVKSFFERGGMQLQVSCLSREQILDAIANPQNHKSLVVRIGGFSEYFTRLSPELQRTVLQRTEH